MFSIVGLVWFGSSAEWHTSSLSHKVVCLLLSSSLCFSWHWPGHPAHTLMLFFPDSQPYTLHVWSFILVSVQSIFINMQIDIWQKEAPGFSSELLRAPQNSWCQIPGHPFCRQLSGCEHTKCKACLSPTSSVFWTLWWVSSAINTSLKGRGLLDIGLRKLKEESGRTGMDFTGGLQNLSSESQASQQSHVISAETVPAPDLVPRWNAVTTKWKRNTNLCYPETRRGSLQENSENSIKLEASFTQKHFECKLRLFGKF